MPEIVPISQRVEAEIQRRFPEADRASVRALLLEYRDRECDRVRFDILQLCESDVAKVRHYVAVAHADYRDVIAWAEYPAEFPPRGSS